MQGLTKAIYHLDTESPESITSNYLRGFRASVAN